MASSVLSDDQRSAFIDRGFFVVPGLLPAAAVAEARTKICRRLGED